MTLQTSVMAPARVAPSSCKRGGPITLQKNPSGGPMNLQTDIPFRDTSVRRPFFSRTRYDHLLASRPVPFAMPARRFSRCSWS